MIESFSYLINGYRLHTYECGIGPLVLFLHGFARSAEDWLPSLPIVAEAGYRAVAVDGPGFGRSATADKIPYSLKFSADCYLGLLDALGAKQAILVAHSMGGKYALATALLAPTRINGLGLVASDGFVVPSPLSKAGRWPWLGRAMLALASRPFLVRAMLRSSFYDPATFVTEEFVAQGRAALAAGPRREAMVALSQRYDETDLRRAGLFARLGELQQPCLIVWGDHDRVFPPVLVERATQALPNAQAVILPRCGHFPHLEAARAFHGLLLGFLAHCAALSAKS